MNARPDIWLDSAAIDRFNANVKPDANGCWIWQASRIEGYGRFSFRGKIERANRVAWVLANRKEIPPGLCACHSCDNPSCVNPEHIWLGTRAENLEDARRKGRAPTKNPLPPQSPRSKPFCKHGHEMTPENTRRTSRGHRLCHACQAEANRRWRAKRTAERRGVAA